MKNPFIAGSWVRGDNFFGRQNLITEVLEGNLKYMWIAGTRRFGKTSVLKQLEFLAEDDEYRSRYLALFWDWQGAMNIDGLGESLVEAAEDAEERLQRIGVSVEALEGKSVFEIIRLLKRRARQHNLSLMLLCDECEELINIARNNPESLARLRRSFQQGEDLITVISATKRLMLLSEIGQEETSPFLHGFLPPHYLKVLEEEEAIRLIEQGGFAGEVVAEIIEKTNRHPYLMQLLCRRLIDTGDLKSVIHQMTSDDMVSHFFAVDFEYLDRIEKRILWFVLHEKDIDETDLKKKTALRSDNLAQLLNSLLQLGYLRQKEGRIRISNFFFERWLRREEGRLFDDSGLRSTKTSVADALVERTGGRPVIGNSLGRYKLIEEIGSGSMGVIFKAMDNRLERLVALKTLSPELAQLSEFQDRFLVEARAASVLNHPNIATIYEIDQIEGITFIAMELILGETLKMWRLRGAGTLREKLAIALQVAEGLRCAHEEGIIHRDIKPENIMINTAGTIKITDFGLAKMSGQGTFKLTRSGATLGTLAYMSPEQAAGGMVDQQSDIFAFGVVLFELITGELPFEALNEASYLYALLHQPARRATDIVENIPPALDALIARLLHKSTDQRYPQMTETLADLSSCLDKLKDM